MNTIADRKTVHRKKAAVLDLAKHKEKRPVQSKPAIEERAKPTQGSQVFSSVFDAIADTADEAANLKARAQLARQITAAFKDKGWTQDEAAEHCRVTQPRISDLVNGRISKFSLDALVNIASALGKVSVQLSELEPA